VRAKGVGRRAQGGGRRAEGEGGDRRTQSEQARGHSHQPEKFWGLKFPPALAGGGQNTTLSNLQKYGYSGRGGIFNLEQ